MRCASDSQCGGQGFDPPLLHHTIQSLSADFSTRQQRSMALGVTHAASIGREDDGSRADRERASSPRHPADAVGPDSADRAGRGPSRRIARRCTPASRPTRRLGVFHAALMRGDGESRERGSSATDCSARALRPSRCTSTARRPPGCHKRRSIANRASTTRTPAPPRRWFPRRWARPSTAWRSVPGGSSSHRLDQGIEIIREALDLDHGCRHVI
jgi:hypothetical protein